MQVWIQPERWNQAQYSDKARADTIALVVMDETNQKMTILSINRDTMTKVRRYTALNGMITDCIQPILVLRTVMEMAVR